MRSPAFRLVLVLTVLGIGGHALLLPVLPLWVSRAGAGEFGAGSTTGVFMATTVATQLTVPWLIRRLGYRAVFGGGLVLLGVPAPFLLVTAALGPVLVLCAARGIGFGLLTVAGSAVVAELVPPAEHGRASSRYGYAIGLPLLVLLPLGVATVDLVGFIGVFLTAAVAPLLGALLVPFLRIPASPPLPTRESPAPDRRVGRPDHPRCEVPGPAWIARFVRSRSHDRESRASSAADTALRARNRRSLVRAGVAPMAAMFAGSVAQGGLVTFLPLVAPSASVAVPLALFAAALGGVVGRGIAGPLVDRRGPGRLLVPGGVLVAVGMGVEVLAVGQTWLFVPGALAVGVGFGMVQNDSLVSLFAAAGPARYGAASAAWNIGFDAGTGAGASGLGAIAQPFGFRAAFATAALIQLATLLLPRSRTGGDAVAEG
ncbi:MFS transporter [Pseudonocardia xishanensis]|uniref:MFS transporter n=1 Tax=Pseudonocardia xishanensis TaxID=630995 RepID=A0ABP8RE35_9PSEU